jgi:predicted nucleic acid-binding protein
VNGYLMDTNHVTEWEAGNSVLLAKLASLPQDTLVCTSAITLGEISAGHEMTSGDPQRHYQVRQFLTLNIVPYAVSISHYTESYYGQIMGRIWRRSSPPTAKVSSDAHLVQLGVGINDVWIVACAWEHGLTLLTADKMTVIRDVTPEVAFDNWLS